MVRSRSRTDQDRFLILRRGIYHYKRRVPSTVAHLDTRSPHVRVSLKTHDLLIARGKRDILETADNDLWSSLLLEEGADEAAVRYRAAVTRAEAMGFRYMTAAEIHRAGSTEMLSRLESVIEERTPNHTVDAVLGLEERPSVTVTKAFKIYTDEIAPSDLRGKSETQKSSWKKVKQRAVDNFVALRGDKDMTEITREDGTEFHKFWMERIAPKEGRPTHAPASGNKDVGNMRVLYEAYFKHIGEKGRQNPFSNLSFTDKVPRSRPPFSVNWITTTLLSGDAFATMRADYRGIMLAMVETGARPSELCNLTADTIFLKAPVPYIAIAPRDDPDAPREIKTVSSIRHIPLVGVSLAVFQKNPSGFPHCVDRENSVTTSINKFMRENKLLESGKHSLYSLRHSFEDRMKNARFDVELRRMLMGHTINRPKYGTGGEMEMWRDELKRIALQFDHAVV